MHSAGGRIVNVRRIVDHPKYSPAKVFDDDYDISLLKLSVALNFSEKIQPIALPDANTQIYDGEFCTTTGFGNLLFIFCLQLFMN